MGTRQTEELCNHLNLLYLVPNFSRGILSNCKCIIASSLDLLSTLTLVLVSAFVKYGLMFDVETNPGPPVHVCGNQVGLKYLHTCLRL